VNSNSELGDVDAVLRNAQDDVDIAMARFNMWLLSSVLPETRHLMVKYCGFADRAHFTNKETASRFIQMVREGR